MKIYLAGTPGVIEREKKWRKTLTRRLLSFWDISNGLFAAREAFFLARRSGRE